MNEDDFNMEMRKFLKKVGVTSQREITHAVVTAIAEGKLTGNEVLSATVTLSMPDIGLNTEIKGDISLD